MSPRRWIAQNSRCKSYLSNAAAAAAADGIRADSVLDRVGPGRVGAGREQGGPVSELPPTDQSSYGMALRAHTGQEDAKHTCYRLFGLQPV